MRSGLAGKAKCDNRGACNVSFFGKAVPAKPNYIVLDTDYDNYSIVYSCNEKINKQIIWVLTRSPRINHATNQKMDQVLAAKVPNFTRSRLRKTHQGRECSYSKRNQRMDLLQDLSFIY